MRRGKPMRTSAFKARASKRDVSVDGEQAALCRTLPCCHCGVHPIPDEIPTHPHHEPLVSQGGEDPDTCPLCDACHRRRHALGSHERWLTKTGCDLLLVTAYLRDCRAKGISPQVGSPDWGC